MAPAVLLVLLGCSPISRPVLLTGPNPAIPGVGTAAASYRSVTSGTVQYEPVAPKPWSDVNDRVAPRRGQAP